MPQRIQDRQPFGGSRPSSVCPRRPGPMLDSRRGSLRSDRGEGRSTHRASRPRSCRGWIRPRPPSHRPRVRRAVGRPCSCRRSLNRAFCHVSKEVHGNGSGLRTSGDPREQSWETMRDVCGGPQGSRAPGISHSTRDFSRPDARPRFVPTRTRNAFASSRRFSSRL